ncbi:DUF5712 family protein [Pedobacter sp. V48]|uniref:DUF5712 family protein n=1 Tax=Pedobacter sp. V48 TaxID=509635 RepID=UPI0003E484AD|nr:DUF5712 family protein [Pedobacter sp. V48]ETZ19545.1 hypothetical protein N824_12450 [Pedobacter sp. V48]
MMYTNITDNKHADNKGSSGQLVNYLEKENRLYMDQDPERWFNHSGRHYEPYEVRSSIDNNIAKLGKDDAKFFLVNISPSQKELKHLKEKYGGPGMSEMLKKYTVNVMDEYARNFNRLGINSSKDLVWFAKLEHHRYYGHTDKEVKDGTKKRGELKLGDQMHIQVIVSRKDWTNKIKLSPMNSSRGRNVEHSKKMGQFDRVAFKQCGETLFDKQFGFERGLIDTMAYANIQKNGTLAQKIQLDTLAAGEPLNHNPNNMMLELVQDVSKGMFETSANMLEAVGSTVGKFLNIMLEPVYNPGVSSAPQEPKRKKKKKKGQGQEPSYQMRM